MPTIQGISPDWASIAIRATPTGGSLVKLGNIKSIKSGIKRTIGKQKEGGRAIKRTVGEVEYECEAEFYQDGYDELLSALVPISPTSGNQIRIGLATLLINMQWSVPNDSRIYERRIKGCMITGIQTDASEGTDAQTTTVTFDPIEIADVKDGREIILI